MTDFGATYERQRDPESKMVVIGQAGNRAYVMVCPLRVSANWDAEAYDGIKVASLIFISARVLAEDWRPCDD